MLAMGDSKATMTDSEMCGTDAGIGTNIHITVEVIKKTDLHLERPLIRTPSDLKTSASLESMEEAVTIANRNMLVLIQRQHAFDKTEAYHFSSLVGGLEISQVVDLLVTVRNSLPRQYINAPF